MFEVLEQRLLHFRESCQIVDTSQQGPFDKSQFTPGHHLFFTRARNPEDRVQNRINPQMTVPAQDDVHPIDDVVMHGMAGEFTQETARYAGVKFFVVGYIVRKSPGRVLQPTLGGSDGTHVRMVIGKPHLKKHRTGPSAAGYEAGQLKVLFRHHVAEPVFVTD